jgi:hypothetical protein
VTSHFVKLPRLLSRPGSGAIHSLTSVALRGDNGESGMYERCGHWSSLLASVRRCPIATASLPSSDVASAHGPLKRCVLRLGYRFDEEATRYAQWPNDFGGSLTHYLSQCWLSCYEQRCSSSAVETLGSLGPDDLQGKHDQTIARSCRRGSLVSRTAIMVRVRVDP